MKNFKRLVAGTIAATMALALSVSAFAAEAEVQNAVKTTYADGKLAFTDTITADNGTQMTVAVFKALDQDETLSAAKLEYINQDAAGALDLSAMGTKNDLLSVDEQGNITYAGDYVIRVGYYVDDVWTVAEGSFTIGEKAAEDPGLEVVWGDLDCSEAVTVDDMSAIVDFLLGTQNTYAELTINEKYGTVLWGDIDCSGAVTVDDMSAIVDFLLGTQNTYGDYTVNVKTTLKK